MNVEINSSHYNLCNKLLCSIITYRKSSDLARSSKTHKMCRSPCYSMTLDSMMYDVRIVNNKLKYYGKYAL